MLQHHQTNPTTPTYEISETLPLYRYSARTKMRERDTTLQASPQESQIIVRYSLKDKDTTSIVMYLEA